MEYLKLFHQDVLTIRSHQWKYYVEPYSGCALQCTYCLYWKSPAFVEPLHPPEDLLEGLERDLAAMPKKQIVYIGYTTDPYQMLEKKLRATRRILECLVRRELPVVILTKSPLILRDLDLLRDLNRRGLVLVQFTVLTTNPAKARVIERGAPAVVDRLRAASVLSAAGIPVHFHLSPVIPGLYDDGELHATVRAIAEHGGQCIYSNILGMRHLNTKVWFDSVEKLRLGGVERTRAAYARAGDPGKNVYSPDLGLIHDEMSGLREICRDNHIDFICEFMPGLDVFDPARFERGIFRFGLPAVYQMARVFEAPPERKCWADFSEALRRRFEAVDEEYLGLVEEFWDDGQLFENTTIGSDVVDGQRAYFQTDRLQLARDSVLAWD
jgi:DNA repair photolyase